MKIAVLRRTVCGTYEKLAPDIHFNTLQPAKRVTGHVKLNIAIY